MQLHFDSQFNPVEMNAEYIFVMITEHIIQLAERKYLSKLCI